MSIIFVFFWINRHKNKVLRILFLCLSHIGSILQSTNYPPCCPQEGERARRRRREGYREDKGETEGSKGWNEGKKRGLSNEGMNRGDID